MKDDINYYDTGKLSFDKMKDGANYYDIGKFSMDLYERSLRTHEQMPNVSDNEAFIAIGSSFMADMQVITNKMGEDIKNKTKKKMFLNESDYIILGKGRVAFLDGCVRSIKLSKKANGVVNDSLYNFIGKMFIEDSISKVNELMKEIVK